MSSRPLQACRQLLTRRTTRRLPQLQHRHASSTPALPATPSPEVEAEDPQLAGLGYPIFAGQSRQHRRAKQGWWDEQERANAGEVVAENEDIQVMWGPDVHPNFAGSQALKYLGVASVVMGAVSYFIHIQTPEAPMERRQYPYDGLKQAMVGNSDLPAARPQTSDDEEDDE